MSLKPVKTTVVGDLFALCFKSVNKLDFDSEDTVHALLTRINHRVFWPTQVGREGHREEEEDLRTFMGFCGAWK